MSGAERTCVLVVPTGVTLNRDPRLGTDDSAHKQEAIMKAAGKGDWVQTGRLDLALQHLCLPGDIQLSDVYQRGLYMQRLWAWVNLGYVFTHEEASMGREGRKTGRLVWLNHAVLCACVDKFSITLSLLSPWQRESSLCVSSSHGSEGFTDQDFTVSP